MVTSSSAISRATPRPASGSIQRRSGSSRSRYFDQARASLSGTAQASRSSSATPSWPSSASRRCTRTTRSGAARAAVELGTRSRPSASRRGSGSTPRGSPAQATPRSRRRRQRRRETGIGRRARSDPDRRCTHCLLSDAVTSELAALWMQKGKGETCARGDCRTTGRARRHSPVTSTPRWSDASESALSSIRRSIARGRKGHHLLTVLGPAGREVAAGDRALPVSSRPPPPYSPADAFPTARGSPTGRSTKC